VFEGTGSIQRGSGKLMHATEISAEFVFSVWLALVTLARRIDRSKARDVGKQVGAQIAWQIDRHLTVKADAIQFFPGPFITQTGRTQGVDFVAVWAACKF
jgi:hypothetical protein